MLGLSYELVFRIVALCAFYFVQLLKSNVATQELKSLDRF